MYRKYRRRKEMNKLITFMYSPYFFTHKTIVIQEIYLVALQKG